PPQRIDEGAIANEPIFLDVAAEMHELVDEIHAGRHAHKKPTDIRGKNVAEDDGHRQRHEDEDHERVGRKDGYPPVLVIAKPHFLVGKKLMMIEGMSFVDRAQALDIDRPVHDEFVDGPLENIREKKRQRHGQPFQQRHVVNVLDVDVKRGAAHRIDDKDVEITIVPAEDSGPIFVAEGDLARADHRRPLGALPLTYHKSITQSRLQGPKSLTDIIATASL